MAHSFHTVRLSDMAVHVNIVEVVGAYTSLTMQDSGRYWNGLCPHKDHHDTRPSFSVVPDRGVWKCFGQCNVGGDVIEFLRWVEGCSHQRALEILSQFSTATVQDLVLSRAKGYTAQGGIYTPVARERVSWGAMQEWVHKQGWYSSPDD